MTDRARAHIGKDDGDDLRWFFRRGGLGVFLLSNMASQLAAASTYAQPAKPCVRCGGDEESDTPGCGFVDGSRSEPGTMGKSARAWLKQHAAELRNWPVPGGQTCPDCKGMGWVRDRNLASKATGPITARPTGSSCSGRDPHSVEHADTDIHKLAVVSRRLSDAEAFLPGTVAVLEAYYSDDGGQLVPLYSLTPAGRTLLRTCSKGLAPSQAFDVLLAAERQQSDPRRKMQLDAAREQSRLLLDQATEAWNVAVHGPSLAAEGAALRARVRVAVSVIGGAS